MVSFRIFASLLLLAAGLTDVVKAAPSSLDTRQAVPTKSKTYLKTKAPFGRVQHGGLYVQAYHIGAGLNDATLTSNISDATPAFLNGTNLQFDLGTSFPWGMVLAYNQFYTSWLDVEINAGYGDGSYSVNGSGLISSNPEWRGWIVCDWYHLVPQLFWQCFNTDFKLPCNCMKVELYLEED